jgi:miniconductance mechanosensitive channel
MEEIRIFVENIIQHFGLEGNTIVLVRHIVLVLVVAVLARRGPICWAGESLSPWGAHHPHTSATWDDVLLGRPCCWPACRIVPALVVWQLLPMVFLPVSHGCARCLSGSTGHLYLTLATVHLFIRSSSTA